VSSEEQEDYWLTEAGLRIRLALLSHDLVWKAYNEVSLMNFKAWGAKEVVWTAEMIPRKTCEYCQDNHGRKWRVGAFLPLMPAHANCKCYWDAVIPK